MPEFIIKQRLERLDRSTDIVCDTRPAYADIARAFHPLFRERLRVTGDFLDRGIEPPSYDKARASHGLPWLADVSLAPFATLLREAVERMLPVMEASFPAADAIQGLSKALRDPDRDLPTACRALLDGNLAAVERLASQAGVDAGLTRFALETVLGPLVAALATLGEDIMPVEYWPHGYCPVCGQPPSIAFLTRRPDIKIDSLVGGGGQKRLHCSLCSSVWRFRRDACPACGSSEPKTREIIHAKGEGHERVEFCHACQTYHLSVDFREFEKDPDLLITPVGLAHLDVIARDRGGSPMYAAPWNSGS